MYGSGFLTHLGKDRFKVSNVGLGRDFKEIEIKLLKKDMIDILKKYGRDSTGKKDEVILKFVEFAKKVPKLWNRQAYLQKQAKSEFIPLEEAEPQFQSKNIKITPKPKATAVVYRSIKRPTVIKTEPEPEPEPETKENLKAKTPYKVLGLSKEASLEEIRKRYKELSRKYHPDKTKSTKEQEIVNIAYKSLMNEITREEEKAKYKNISGIITKAKIPESSFIKEFFKLMLRIPIYNSESDRKYASDNFPKVIEILRKHDLKEVALFAKDLYNSYVEAL